MKDLEITIKVRNNQLKERRLLANLTQVEMAQKIGISLGSYSGLETMRDKPYNDIRWSPSALCIAAYYHISPEVLFPEFVRDIEVTVATRKLNKDDLELFLLPTIGDYSRQLLYSPEQVVDNSILRKRIQSILPILSSKEQTVIKLRYGLDGESPYTLDEIGEVLNLSKERIRQFEAKALCYLRKILKKEEL